jgi:hypothetical protein
MIRLVLFLGIGITAVTLFKDVGAPVLAFAEIALLIEAIILFGWLSRRTHQPIRVGGAVGKGLIAAAVGGGISYLLAVYLPGSAILTALLGMSIGGLAALAIVWSEARLLFKL